jgi:cytochrome c oxidase cbb3-type subunit 4
MTYETATVVSQTAALILFFSMFVGVIAYVCWPGNKKKFERAAELPLAVTDDERLGDRS